MLNAASNAKGVSVSPGSLVSIYGTALASTLANADSIPLSTTLGNVTVTFNNIPAPLLYVSSAPQQINAQVPWELAGQHFGADRGDNGGTRFGAYQRVADCGRAWNLLLRLGCRAGDRVRQ